MSTLSKRSTVYFEPTIHNVLKMRAASSDSSVSELVDEAVRLLMREDQEHPVQSSSAAMNCIVYVKDYIAYCMRLRTGNWWFW